MKKSFGKKTLLPLLLLSTALGLSACGEDEENSDGGVSSGKSPIEFKAALSAAEVPVIPAVSSGASGSLSFSLDPGTHVLSGSVMFEGLVATNAHVHSGAAGKSGDIVIGLVKDSTQNRYDLPDNTVLSAEQEQALLDGAYYVNVHSQAYPAGELRGQILPEGKNLYLTELSSQELLSPVISAGSARAFMVIDTANGELEAVLKLDGITATNAHIHDAYAGYNGGVVLAFQQSSDPSLWEISARSLTPEQDSALANGRYYFNVHTQANASGELRGQILPPGLLTDSVDLQAVDGVVTDAAGTVYLTLDENTRSLTVVVRTTGVSITAMHIHQSSDNGIVVGLTQSTDAAVWELLEQQLSEAQLNELMQGNYYVNVHSAAYPAGELRATLF